MGNKSSKSKSGAAPAEAPAAEIPAASSSNNTNDEQKKKFAPIERTLAIVKPDAVAAGKVQELHTKLEEQGFTIIMEKEFQLTEEQAGEFYIEHKEKPFFSALCEYMSSGPSYVMILSKVEAMKDFRKIMGPTDPDEARAKEPASFRALYGVDKLKNAIHGSETPEATAREIDFFFPGVSA